MAGKPKPMSQIKQLLILHRQKQGIKAIARSLSMSRNTVKAYLFKLEKLLGDPVGDLSADQILGMEEPEIYQLFHPGNPSYKDIRYEHFKSLLKYPHRQ
jgi:transcriptional antiterminator